MSIAIIESLTKIINEQAREIEALKAQHKPKVYGARGKCRECDEPAVTPDCLCVGCMR